MNIEELRDYCFTKDNVEEGFPFGETTLVFKRNEKIFFLLTLDTLPIQFNVKCNPEKAIEFRETYDCVKPGYHMNKKHWNTVILDGTLNWNQITEMIDHSYELVVKGKK